MTATDEAVEPVRIVSLLPSATEILFAIGVGDQVVGVTHECDHPDQARDRVSVTRDLLPPGMSPADIDEAVTAGIRDQHTIYALDDHALGQTRPDVVVAQELCDVCAVPVDAIDASLCTMAPAARIVAADPHRLRELGAAILAIGEAVGAATGAAELVARLGQRLDAVRAGVAGADRPGVAVLEWPDPVWVPGHWVPDMVAAAGGTNLLGAAGVASVRAGWDDVQSVRPEIVVAAFCGYDLATTMTLVDDMGDDARWRDFVGDARVVAVNGSALFSRPGPRLIEGVEVLAHALHGVGAAPAAEAARERVANGWVPVAAGRVPPAEAG